MVKAKMETIYEQYQFNGTQLVGTPSDIEIELSAQEQELLGNTVNSWKWYKWDANTLQSQGLDGKMLGKNKYFLVNYEHFEILYSQKTSGENGEYYHSMTGLEKLLEN